MNSFIIDYYCCCWFIDNYIPLSLKYPLSFAYDFLNDLNHYYFKELINFSDLWNWDYSNIKKVDYASYSLKSKDLIIMVLRILVDKQVVKIIKAKVIKN